MEYSLTMCNSCVEELDDDLKGACPDCGGTIKTLRAGWMGNQTLTMADQGNGVKMVYGDQDQNPWQEQWHRMRASFSLLKQHYAGGNYPGDRQVASDVREFFGDCFHVGDWIWEDVNIPLDKKTVSAFILADNDLRLCEGMVNTTKHRTRTNPKRVVAWVDDVQHDNDTDKAKALIKWKTDTDNGEVDALELAKRCYTAWRKFHKDKQLKTMP